MKGRTPPPSNNANQINAAHARDRAYFLLFPERTQFRRKYICGEWPEGDTVEGGPLTWVVIWSPVIGARIRMYCTDTDEGQQVAHIITDGDTFDLHLLAVQVLKDSAIAAGGGLREVRI